MRGPFGENALGPAELVREREPDGLALRFGLPYARIKSIYTIVSHTASFISFGRVDEDLPEIPRSVVLVPALMSLRRIGEPRSTTSSHRVMPRT